MTAHVVNLWINGQNEEVDVTSLSNEELLVEYAGECEGEARRCSGDPIGNGPELRAEILRRMSNA